MLSEKFWNSTINLKIDSNPVYIIREFFDKNTAGIVNAECKRLLDSKHIWDKLNMQTDLQRKVFQGRASETFSSILEYFNTEAFLKRFSTFISYSVTRIDFNLWWDYEGYILPMHLDNDKVELSMQIYVGTLEHSTLGTSFGDLDQNLILTLPYRFNSGYFLPNPTKVQHGLISPVPANFDRLSLYFYIS